MRLDHGRTGQKARTRQDPLAAARRAMERGDRVAAVAAANGAVASRATACRSFSTCKVPAVGTVPDSTMASQGICQVGDAMVDRIGASTVEAILDRFLPRDGRHSRPTGIGGSCKRLE